MKTYDGYIKYNDEGRCYGMMGHDGVWIKKKLESGDRIDIAINGEQFATDFRCNYEHPVLAPHSWDNWEFLSTLPATYYDFEKVPEATLSPKEERHIRWKIALFIIAGGILFPALLGALFALMVEECFLTLFSAMFWFLGAGLVAGAILIVINILPVDLCVGFGCALYYGTIALAAFLSDFIFGADENRYVIAFVIVALTCYIVWLKNFKEKYHK